MMRLFPVTQLCERLPRVFPIVRKAWVKAHTQQGIVVIKHRSTDRYLADGGEWISDVRDAHQFADAERARWMIARHACEIPAFELHGELETN